MVKTTLLYGAETWKIAKKYKAKMEGVEIDAMRWSLHISRDDKIRNEIIMQRKGTERSVIRDIDMKQGYLNKC